MLHLRVRPPPQAGSLSLFTPDSPSPRLVRAKTSNSLLAQPQPRVMHSIAGSSLSRAGSVSTRRGDSRVAPSGTSLSGMSFKDALSVGKREADTLRQSSFGSASKAGAQSSSHRSSQHSQNSITARLQLIAPDGESDPPGACWAPARSPRWDAIWGERSFGCLGIPVGPGGGVRPRRQSTDPSPPDRRRAVRDGPVHAGSGTNGCGGGRGRCPKALSRGPDQPRAGDRRHLPAPQALVEFGTAAAARARLGARGGRVIRRVAWARGL